MFCSRLVVWLCSRSRATCSNRGGSCRLFQQRLSEFMATRFTKGLIHRLHRQRSVKIGIMGLQSLHVILRNFFSGLAPLAFVVVSLGLLSPSLFVSASPERHTAIYERRLFTVEHETQACSTKEEKSTSDVLSQPTISIPRTVTQQHDRRQGSLDPSISSCTVAFSARHIRPSSSLVCGSTAYLHMHRVSCHIMPLTHHLLRAVWHEFPESAGFWSMHIPSTPQIARPRRGSRGCLDSRHRNSNG